mmetsp:Transcript_13645/g.18899  ORF Transcript_13645/g.18899 Transcript_13645/m.18899 type:complete len:93 (-) Transcript_13645:25-303(-)
MKAKKQQTRFMLQGKQQTDRSFHNMLMSVKSESFRCPPFIFMWHMTRLILYPFQCFLFSVKMIDERIVIHRLVLHIPTEETAGAMFCRETSH